MLNIFSFLFLVVGKIRFYFYRVGVFKSHTFDAKVISVGNIHLGGTGKTPFVIHLCEELLKLGQKPVILSRGYKSGLRSNEYAVIKNGVFLSGRELHADEALLQSFKLKDVPVVLGANRVSAYKHFINDFSSDYKVSHIILDDGFQHFKIKRDLDIVLCHQPSGNLISDGLLREPYSSLKRADIVASHNDISAIDHPNILKYEILNLPLECVHEGEHGRDINGGFTLICGIANPGRFQESVASLGISVSENIILKDHQLLSRSLLSNCNGPILTTEKDYFRDQSVFKTLKMNVYVLPIKISIDPHSFGKIKKYL